MPDPRDIPPAAAAAAANVVAALTATLEPLAQALPIEAEPAFVLLAQPEPGQ